MNILNILVGTGLVILGRKYLWIFTAGIFYFFTIEIIDHSQYNLPDTIILFVAMVLAASGALLAGVLKPIAIVVPVFLASSYLFSLPAEAYQWFPGQTWLTYLIGGGLGLVLIAGATNWTFIVLSSLIGGLLVTRGIPINPAWSLVAFLGVALAGIIIQILILVIGRQAVIPIQEEVEAGTPGNLSGGENDVVSPK
jgi:hypothetical protein